MSQVVQWLMNAMMSDDRGVAMIFLLGGPKYRFQNFVKFDESYRGGGWWLLSQIT